MKKDLKSIIEKISNEITSGYVEDKSLDNKVSIIMNQLELIGKKEQEEKAFTRAVVVYSAVKFSLLKNKSQSDESAKRIDLLNEKIKDNMDLHLNGCSALFEKFEAYRETLKHARFSSYAEALEVQKTKNYSRVREIVENDCNNYRALINKIVIDCIGFLKQQCLTPKGKFCLTSLGSLSRNEGTLFSDFENMLLIEKKEDTDFFTKLSELMHFCIIGLGETPIPISWYGINFDDIIPFGLCFDLGGKSILGRKHENDALSYKLIKTPEEMAKLVTKESELLYRKDDPQLCHELTDFRIISGASSLEEEYRAKIKEVIPEELRKIRALGELKNDMRKFTPHTSLYTIGAHFDVKNNLYRLFNLPISRLGYFYGIECSSSWEIIEKLKSRKILTKEVIQKLEDAINKANLMRLLVYSNKGFQNGNVYLKSMRFNADSELPMDESEISKLYSTSFIWYALLEHFSQHHSFPKDQSYTSETKVHLELKSRNYRKALDLMNGQKDPDLSLKAYCYQKLGEMDKAKETYNKAIQSDKNNLTPISMYATYLTNIGELQGAKKLLPRWEALAEKSSHDYACYLNCLSIISENAGEIESAIKANDQIDFPLDQTSSLMLQENKIKLYTCTDKQIKEYKAILEKKLRLLGIWHSSVSFTYINLFLCYLENKNFELALKCLDQANKIFDKLGETENLLLCKAYYLNIYTIWGRKDKADEYYKMIDKEGINKYSTFSSYNIILYKVASYIHEYVSVDKAIEHIKEVSERFHKMNPNDKSFHYLRMRIELANYSRKNPDEALNIYKDILENTENYPDLKARVCCRIADVYLNQLKNESAIQYFKIAKEIYSKEDNHKEYANVLVNLIRANKQIDPSQSTKYIKELEGYELNSMDKITYEIDTILDNHTEENLEKLIKIYENIVSMPGSNFTEKCQTTLYNIIMISIELKKEEYVNKFYEKYKSNFKLRKEELGVKENSPDFLDAKILEFRGNKDGAILKFSQLFSAKDTSDNIKLEIGSALSYIYSEKNQPKEALDVLIRIQPIIEKKLESPETKLKFLISKSATLIALEKYETSTVLLVEIDELLSKKENRGFSEIKKNTITLIDKICKHLRQSFVRELFPYDNSCDAEVLSRNKDDTLQIIFKKFAPFSRIYAIIRKMSLYSKVHDLELAYALGIKIDPNNKMPPKKAKSIIKEIEKYSANLVQEIKQSQLMQDLKY